MKKKLFVLIMICTAIIPSLAHAQVLPLFSYDYLKFDKKKIHSPSIGCMYMRDDFYSVALYTMHVFNNEEETEYPDLAHSLQWVSELTLNRHTYLGIVKSDADKPFYSGPHSFTAGAVWGYEVLKSESFACTLGAGLVYGDFGIEMSDGTIWPLLPVPLIRATYKSRYMQASLEFLTGPNLELLFAPRSTFRLKIDSRMDKYEDIRDLVFEAAMHWRFFSEDHELGDFAGISTGIKSDENVFMYTAEKEDVRTQYYAVFAALDLSLIKIEAGRIMDSFEFYKKQQVSNGTGFYISVQAMLFF